MTTAPHASEFLDPSGLRMEVERAILSHADMLKGSETDTASFLRLIGATSEAVELCEKLQRDAVHQARRADIPWSEIGGIMGITRQAAQQRFAPEENTQPLAKNTRRIIGVTAFNEMEILTSEGKAGYHLVDFGALYLTVMASKDVWEHRRLLSLNILGKRENMETAGWIYVGSWFPFHYFKRIVS